jgi:regulator of sigma E protease
MNFILAAILFTVVFSVIGVSERFEPVIGEVQPDSPAAVSGVLPGDRILSIDGEELSAWHDLTRIVSSHREGGALSFRVLRGEQTITIEIEPRYLPEEGRAIIGVVVDQSFPIIERTSPIEAIGLGLTQTFAIVSLVISLFVQMLTGQIGVVENLTGPVGVAVVIVETASTGLTNTLLLTALLSVSLGIMNLMPIPALDGGKIIVYIIEMFRRKPLKVEVEGWLNAAGFALMILLALFLTYNDIARIVGRP